MVHRVGDAAVGAGVLGLALLAQLVEQRIIARAVHRHVHRLARVAGTKEIEVTSADLVSRLDDALARNRNRLTEMTRQSLRLEQRLEELNRTDTLAADDQTQRLIAYYHEKGIAAGDLKSYPEYLTSLYEQPERIAVFSPQRNLRRWSAHTHRQAARLPCPAL